MVCFVHIVVKTFTFKHCTRFYKQRSIQIAEGETVTTYARILKAHSHSMSGSSIWDSFECQCCFWIAGEIISYLTMWLLTLQLFKNSIDTQWQQWHITTPLRLLGFRRRNNDYDLNLIHQRIQNKIDGPHSSPLVNELDPDGVRERKAKTLRRRTYYTPGSK